ncbi:alpha-amylase family glycosyl hydrolase [Gordonia sp. CPCC 206044]|uniref:alpha-amylase family glycosyl hydrolase n=1 Tax=Gordonia sp. CPCC 206044 TaxID=3140793 RepID=UPI003AF3F290
MRVPEPDWVATSIWWHVYPLGALGADTTGVDRTCHRPLSALIDWLDHVIDLGANGLALGPIFRSATHGYDTLDHLAIDERLGTIDDFTQLVDACRSRGIRVMLDGVFNHVSKHHRAVADPGGTGHSGWARRGDGPDGVAAFEGHADLVELDHSRPEVADLVVEVMTHWAQTGIDAWRLDAAYAVPNDFWHSVIPRVRADFPDVYVVGEMIHGDYPAAVREGGLNSVTQYELWKAIWSAVTDVNMHELAWSLQRHNDMLDTFVPWTFVGNHDVTRMASRLDTQMIDLTTVILATVGGTPAVYYGDELGWTGVKEERFGGDDAIRTALPDHPDEALPDRYRVHQRLIGLRRRHPGVHQSPVTCQTVDQGLLVYRVEIDPALVVAVNANPHAVTTELHHVDELDGDRSNHHDGQLHLDAGGWFVGVVAAH